MKYKVTDKFLGNYRELVRTQMIPFQWNVLNDAIDVNIEKERDDDFIPNEKSHAIENFKIAAGINKGDHYGWVFQDSDVYKWLEAVAYSLRDKHDKNLQDLADSVVELIGMAQEEDGYINTYFTIKAPDRRFKRLGESHELYCAGHFIEAAVAYYETTGSEKVLEIAKKLADCIDNTFGKEEGKINGYDGHEEIELALMKLYHITFDERYLNLAKYFIDERGKNPDFFREQISKDKGGYIIKGVDSMPDTYFQNHAPVYEQTTAEGHAVRLVYMCTALADIVATTGDEKLLKACKTLWRNIVDKRMYITGGIGSTVIGESFTEDYDLPNDVMYCETCASIGLIFFAKQMLLAEADGEYADVMEKALYNTAIAGMALDGRHFFYVNPLEVVPNIDKKNPTKSHVKVVRPEWLGCACCPPNLARLVTSIEKYIYSFTKDAVLLNLFVDSKVEEAYNGQTVKIKQTTTYPKKGNVLINVEADKPFKFGIRIPSWADKYTIAKNGTMIDIKSDKGFAYIEAENGDAIEVDFVLDIIRWYSNNRVRTNVGLVAFSRGPIVYCAEGVDNGENLHLISVKKDSDLRYVDKTDFNDIDAIIVKGLREKVDEDSAPLYARNKSNEYEELDIKLIPYYAWANRGENEMRVWINEK